METRQATHPTPPQLAALALGKLRPEASERLQAHVSACASCAAFLAGKSTAELQTLLAQISRPPGEAERTTPAGQWDRSTTSVGSPAPQARSPSARGLSPQPSRPAEALHDASIPPELRAQTKYRIVRLLGRGGMGSVYEVHHERMDRCQALKVINPELVDNPQALLRFEQEIKAVAKLDHPNIARAYDAESFGSLQVIVMEFVAGQPLHEFLKKRGRLTVKEASRCVRQACLGLQHAFERGLVHRDLKPQNLMLARDTGVIKILDFGLAKVVSEKKPTHGLTQTNMTMGTFEYMVIPLTPPPPTSSIRAWRTIRGQSWNWRSDSIRKRSVERICSSFGGRRDFFVRVARTAAVGLRREAGSSATVVVTKRRPLRERSFRTRISPCGCGFGPFGT